MNGQLQEKIPKKNVFNDFEQLYKSLIDGHYNIYAYISKHSFDSLYFDIKSSIKKDSLSLLETTNIFQKFVASAKNGHTEIDFPIDIYRQYAFSNGSVFPLEIAFENHKPLIRKNWSSNKKIPIGSEIISINNVQIKEILNEMYSRLSAERTYLKQVKIELISFPRLYWQMFGYRKKFKVKIRINDKIKTFMMKPINVINDYETKREEVLNSRMSLEFFKNTAYLNPGNFSGNERFFKNFIDSSFAVIKKKGRENLIIDFRNNAGGNDAFSDYLISYFAKAPFQWNSHFSVKSSQTLKTFIQNNHDTTDVYWKKILLEENGVKKVFEFNPVMPQPSEKLYKGNVYILINRQSHSQSAVAAAQIQDYKFGVLVGEETGEYPSLYASQFHINLFHTKIIVKVSKGRIVRINGDTSERGVIPDILEKDYLLDENDEILQTLLKRLENRSCRI